MTAHLSHVNVTRVGDELVVTWRGGGRATSVFVSADPDDAGVDVRAPDGPGRAVLAAGPERVFVHVFDPAVGFVVAAERRLPFDGADNFRDLGGYPTVDGGWTRWGRVYRADGLADLSAVDLRRLGDLGVARVFDLRAPAEVEAAPDRLPAGVVHEHLPMSSDVARTRTMIERVAAGELTAYDEDDMAAGYVRMLEHFGDAFARIVTAVAEGEPVVVHCTAGKDRTGIAAMVLLALAGVGDGHILDDYELTARYRDNSRLAGFRARLVELGVDPDDFAAMWGSPRPVMRATIDGLRAGWGSVEGFLDAHGVSAPTIAAARATLRGAA